MGTFTQGEATPAPRSLADDKQVKEEVREHNLKFWIEKGLAGSFYYFDETVGKISGFSQQEIDFVLLEQAKELGPLTQLKTPEKMKRFNEVMDHFLSGSSRTLYFKMADLLNSCAGARHRVSEAISFRLARDTDLILGNPSCDLSTHVDLSSGKPVQYSDYQFPIHQGDYHDTDWQFTLGTFGAMWEPIIPKRGSGIGVLCRSNVGDDWIDEGTMALTRNESPQACVNLTTPRPTQAKVWGTKIWRWHSETDRVSEKVHQAAHRLVQSGLLKNFWVIGQPCIVDISSGQPTH